MEKEFVLDLDKLKERRQNIGFIPSLIKMYRKDKMYNKVKNISDRELMLTVFILSITVLLKDIFEIQPTTFSSIIIIELMCIMVLHEWIKIFYSIDINSHEYVIKLLMKMYTLITFLPNKKKDLLEKEIKELAGLIYVEFCIDDYFSHYEIMFKDFLSYFYDKEIYINSFSYDQIYELLKREIDIDIAAIEHDFDVYDSSKPEDSEISGIKRDYSNVMLAYDTDIENYLSWCSTSMIESIDCDKLKIHIPEKMKNKISNILIKLHKNKTNEMKKKEKKKLYWV